ncbi:hypothetical protein H310_00118 [Aphanomyces invadans]|uniref:Uncharacterized protein n=1 Tax=Aphanomyces invadans TaxID=157072 RepID=A0A024UUH0_9STRA|nr:hypothetical protein H310_00118 [Aphanomyces invadans]ETW09567.1 hypothetical protein H310_00118 [Aphanomyces invadans]|eukprot:XP_008860978.1 hypothetical protein H310_00118 [Aphanomyces invadans]
MNRSGGEALHCFWNETVGSCHKSDWSACGYDWLAKVPVGLVWLVWFFAGTYALSQFGTLKFDTSIHDPLGQGIAIALSQRKSTSVRRPWLLRYIKLCAIWAEWPTFTFTPLTIAFKISKEESALRLLNLNVDEALEVFGVVLVACCGVGIVVLRNWKKNVSGEAILKKTLYPITFDLFFIPTTTLLARIGTCPEGFAHIALPSGASCECVNTFAVFWAIGFGGFLVLYCSAMYYKMHIEPHGTTMDFRFQTSFQIMMAMARTVNPIVSILVILLNVHIYPARATPIACAFLIMVTYLLIYSYKTQPCIGSGRVPNNIRVVSFSSSVYSSVCVFVFCVTGSSITSLYYSLVPLPLVWLTAWTINDRRAKLFYIPYRPIVDLLVMSEARPQLAGVIAALYVDPMKIHAKDYTLIVARLYAIARSSDAEPQSRMHALRTLWFLHCKNFRKTKGQFGEPEDEMLTLPPKLWLKDRENPDRIQWTKAGMAKTGGALSNKQTQVKIARIDQLSDVRQDDVVAPELAHFAAMSKASGRSGRLSRTVGTSVPPDSTPRVESTHSATHAMEDGTAGETPAFIRPPRTRSIAVPSSARSSFVTSTELGVIRIRDKQWLSRNEDSVEAVQHCDELFRLAKEVMVTCTTIADKPAMFEAAMYLLQLYQARYLRLNKVTYVRIVSSLCATDHMKTAIDAVHTLYKLVLDAVLAPELWLRTSSSLDLLLCAMDHPSTLTVAKCVIVAKAILVAAEADVRMNLFSLLTPASIARLRSAFLDYHANYQISTTLEDICAGLHRMELQRGAKHRDDLQRRVAASSLMRNLTQSIAKSTVSVGIERSMPSRRLSLRVSPVDPLVTTTLQQMPTRDGGANAASVRVHDMDGGSARDLQKIAVNVPTTVPHGRPVHVTGMGHGASGGGKIQYLFVQADVIEEIHRRRTVRAQFEQALMRAYHIYNEGRSAATVAAPTDQAATPTSSTMSRKELPASFSEIMELYAVPGCALEGMLASVVEPHMKQFFESQVMPFMIIR